MTPTRRPTPGAPVVGCASAERRLLIASRAIPHVPAAVARDLLSPDACVRACVARACCALRA
eukprot:14409628-Alexandrium_andersonii.AAC.1